MIERCQDLGFPLEPRHTIVVARELFQQNLDRNFTLELRIAGGTLRPFLPCLEAQLFRESRVARLSRSPSVAAIIAAEFTIPR
jgi:hypothetical protein